MSGVMPKSDMHKDKDEFWDQVAYDAIKRYQRATFMRHATTSCSHHFSASSQPVLLRPQSFVVAQSTLNGAQCYAPSMATSAHSANLSQLIMHSSGKTCHSRTHITKEDKKLVQ